MVDILQTAVSNSFSLMKIFLIENPDSNLTEVCPKGLVDKSSLVHVNAWCQRGDKPLLEQMLSKVAGA